MPHNLASLRRLLSRILSFLAIVCYDIHKGIRWKKSTSTYIKSRPNDDADHHSRPEAPINHIQTIPNEHMSRNDTSIRISFSLHDPNVLPFTNEYVIRNCELGKLRKGGHRTDIMPPNLQLGQILQNNHPDIDRSGGRVLDVTTTISTNLKIFQIGDSITIEIAEALDEMLGGYELGSRTSLWESWGGADGGTLTAPTRGGGIHGAVRMTGLLSRQNQGKPTMTDARGNHARPLEGLGGGWNYHMFNPFFRHVYHHKGTNVTVGKHMDVVIFRVMHGWMDVHEITRERIIEAATLANLIMGAKTIMFMTVPFTNNVNTIEIMEGVNKINDMIWDVAKNWHLDHETNILVMEYAQYCNHVTWANARNIGYNVSDPLTATPQIFRTEGPKFLQDRLNINIWPPSIPMVCAKKPTTESKGAYCERNMLFEDGMHFCTDTMAARIGAGIACLLGCVYNHKKEVVETLESEILEEREAEVSKMRACERQCNEQFLSVMPLKESWIVDSSTTLASFADS